MVSFLMHPLRGIIIKGVLSMLCRNCNYILSGKENFCPNCGVIPLATSQPFPGIRSTSTEESSDTKKADKSTEKAPDKKDFIFTEADKGIFLQDEQDFLSPEEDTHESFTTEDSKKSRKPTAKILILLFLCCGFTVAAFLLAEHFGILPGLSTAVSSFDNGSTSPLHTFSHAETVIEPEIDYPMVTAYVLTGKGLTLRKGPGNGYSPLSNLTDLTQVQVCGGSLANGNWVYVYCGEKESYGWLDGSYLCSETVAGDEFTSEYDSPDDVPTAYYAEEE